MTPDKPKPALFLDRDGVINKNYGFVSEKENFDFVEGIFEFATWMKSCGYYLVVVTNQSGIGRGLFSQEQFDSLTTWMRNQFSERSAALDLVLVETMNPEDPFVSDIQVGRRKPAPGMFFEARDLLNIDLSNSIMIGDSLSDMEAAINAGVSNRFLLDTTMPLSTNYFVVKDFAECRTLINSSIARRAENKSERKW
jgi:D-glycero-D-manno-heptose 1,7-bisphosphate phosphatase